MNELLITKAKKIEQFNLTKSKEIIDRFATYIESRKIEFPDEKHTLFCKNMALYFDKFKVIYEPLKGRWADCDENLGVYIGRFDNIAVSLYMNDRESARIELGRKDDIVLDGSGFLNLEKNDK